MALVTQVDFDLIIRPGENRAEERSMTLISILERKPVHPLPRCASCDAPALVVTPAGLACHEHAVQDVRRSLGARDGLPVTGPSSQR